LGAAGEAHRRYGDWDFGPEAGLSVQQREQRFIDHWMRDADNGFVEEPPVKIFLMGDNRWIDLADWPPPDTEQTDWYLNVRGKLTREHPANVSPDRYTYDPLNPVPTLGGPIYWGLAPEHPLGPVDQRPNIGREDVLLYQSEVLADPIAVVGEITAHLWIASSAPDTDFVAKLCVTEPRGAVTCIAAGSLRCRYREDWSKPKPLEPDTPTEISIHLGQTAYVFPAGSQIAFTVTSSCFPRILPHPNTMAPTWDGAPPQVARQQVLHDATYPSRIALPTIPL
jgi:putative CocE/NonD family hydrolase